MQAEHVGPAADRPRPTAGSTRAGRCAQAGGVAAVEVPQVRPLQRQRVARVVEQQLVPDATGGVPAAVEHQLRRRQVGRARARRPPAASAPARVQLPLRLGARSDGSVRLSRKPAFITCGSSQPRVVGDRGVEVGQRRVVERHHAPQRASRPHARSAAARRRCRLGIAAQRPVARRRPRAPAHRPRPLRRPQLLPRARQPQHAQVVVAAADDLQADRQAVGGVAAVDRRRPAARSC